MGEDVSTNGSFADKFKEIFPDSISLEVKKHSFGIGSEGTSIRVHCALEYDHFSGTNLVAGESELRPVPVELTFRRDQAAYDEIKEKGAIGYLSYHDAMKTDDGVGDSDAGVEGTIVLSNDLFDRIFPLLRQGDPGARLTLYVEPLRDRDDWAPVHGHSWDVKEKPNIHILNFSYFVPAPEDLESVEDFDYVEEYDEDPGPKSCRFCAEEMKAEAEVCPHCGKNQKTPERISGLILGAWVLAITGWVAYSLFDYSKQFDIQPVDLGTTFLFFLKYFVILAIIGTIPFYAWMLARKNSPKLLGSTREEMIEMDRDSYIGCYTILVLGGSFVISLISTIIEAHEYLLTALMEFFSV